MMPQDHGPTSIVTLMVTLTFYGSSLCTIELLDKMSGAGLPALESLAYLAAGVYITGLLGLATWRYLLD